MKQPPFNGAQPKPSAPPPPDVPPPDQRLVAFSKAMTFLVEYRRAQSGLIGEREGWVPALAFVRVDPKVDPKTQKPTVFRLQVELPGPQEVKA